VQIDQPEEYQQAVRWKMEALAQEWGLERALMSANNYLTQDGSLELPQPEDEEQLVELVLLNSSRLAEKVNEGDPAVSKPAEPKEAELAAKDQELNWEDFPNVEPERTTVTKRVRRIFTFSEMQYRQSIARLRPDIVHLGFCDYLLNEVELIKTLNKMMAAHAHYKVAPQVVYSFGPCTTDVLSLHDAVERLSNGN
jgi:hypothetical protein